MDIIKKTREKITDFRNLNSEEKVMLEDCHRFITFAKNYGIDTTDAESLYVDAKTAFSIRSDNTGKILLKKAKREIRNKLNSRDKARMRIILTGKGLDSLLNKANFAKERYGLNKDNSLAFRLIEMINNKKIEGDYSGAEGLAWRAEKILEDEVKEIKRSRSAMELIDTLKQFLEYLEPFDIDTTDLKNEINRVEEYLREEPSDANIFLASSIFSQILEVIKSNNIIELMDGVDDILYNHDTLDERLVKIENNFAKTRDLDLIKTDIEKSYESLSDLRYRYSQLNSEVNEYLKKEEKFDWSDYVRFEIKKLYDKIDFLIKKQGLCLTDIKDKLDEIDINSKEKISENIKAISEIDALLEEALIEHGSTKNIENVEVMSKSEEKEIDKDTIIKRFSHSPRINADGLDFKSKTIVLCYPSVSSSFIDEVAVPFSHIYWEKYDPLDFKTITEGLKLFDEMVDLKRIILLNMCDNFFSEDIAIFKEEHSNDISEILSPASKGITYIDSSNDFESLFSWWFTKNIGCEVFDITINKSFGDIHNYRTLLEDLV